MLDNPSTLASASSAAPRDAAPCVYFDGACPLCSREIAVYRAAEGGSALRWIDAHRCDDASLGPQLDRTRALERLHVRRADGTLVSGAAAFVEIWRALPAFAWLARIARVPGVLPVMEIGYRAFLRVRRAWRRPPQPTPSTTWPRALRRELRTDHAGETGAVMIYRGVLAVARDAALRDFAQHHLATERTHLVEIERIVPTRERSALLPLWRLSGWLTGALPALISPRAVYATIEAVETFVDRHYAAQVALVDEIDPQGSDASLATLRALLEQCRLDEVAHRDDAHARREHAPGGLLRLWTTIVAAGSAGAVVICRFV